MFNNTYGYGMENNLFNFQELIEKIKAGKSTPEEEVALSKYINSSLEIALGLIAELKKIKSPKL